MLVDGLLAGNDDCFDAWKCSYVSHCSYSIVNEILQEEFLRVHAICSSNSGSCTLTDPAGASAVTALRIVAFRRRARSFVVSQHCGGNLRTCQVLGNVSEGSDSPGRIATLDDGDATIRRSWRNDLRIESLQLHGFPPVVPAGSCDHDYSKTAAAGLRGPSSFTYSSWSG